VRGTTDRLLAISEDFAMRKQAQTVATRTEQAVEGRELPLEAPSAPPPTTPRREHRAADRIKDALLRWLEEEM
jgi:hypothetical protein